MKNHLAALGACLLLTVCACRKEGASLAPLPSPATDSAGFKTYVIKKGEHFANDNALRSIETEALAFTVHFDSSAIYQTLDPDNQHDINKLYGFSDNGAAHHRFSARFGWRWSEGTLWLFAYTYNNGVREAVDLGEAPIGKELHCRIGVTDSSYVFAVDGRSTSVPRKSKGKAKGYRLYPYFGGDETAPHEVRICIREE